MMIIANWAIAFCAITTGLHLATIAIASWRCSRRRSASEAIDFASPVTLVVPVCGIDPFVAETLGSSFCLDYPHYEIIFCIANAGDPAVPAVRRLIAANPDVGARLLVGDNRISANPKLNNIAKGWDAARHRWIAVADSNALLPRDYLTRLLGRWRHDTGAVCSMPIGTRPTNFAAEIECAFLNTLQARFQYVSEALGFGFAQGKTMLFRRDLVDRAGGLATLAIDIAEDAATTKMVRGAGLNVHLVDTPVEQPLGRRRMTEIWARQLRWARLRRSSFPWLFLPEILVGSALPCLAIASAAAYYEVSVPGAVGLLLMIWVGTEAALASIVGWCFPVRMIAAILLRDLLLPLLWIAAWMGNDFVWRGTAMHATAAVGPYADPEFVAPEAVQPSGRSLG